MWEIANMKNHKQEQTEKTKEEKKSSFGGMKEKLFISAISTIIKP